LQLLLADAHQDEVKALLTVALAERIFRAGDTKTAEELLKPISTQPDHSRFAARAREMLEKIRSGGVLKVGVLLPLLLHAGQRAEKEPGEELLAGVKLATEEHNLIAFPKVSLEVRDSEREPSVAARRTEELCADNEVIAIVGPAHSAEALQSAQIANSRGVPMITPTATASGIAAVGSYIFQANPDHATRGRIMAQYARTQLGAQTAALVVPNDEVGRAQAESFINESERNGLEVVDVQWYEPGATDLRQQFMALRQKALARTDPYVIDFSSKLKSADLTKLLRFGVPQRTLDSLVERGSVVSVSVLLGPAGKRIADSLKIPTQSLRQKVDSLTIPVKTIDVLYLPIADAEEIGVVSSQVRYFNFASTLLGGGEWNDPFELEQHRQYTDGMIFPSDSYWSENDARYRAFAARYENTFGTKPTKNVLYTYDLMKALLTIIANGARQRDEIATALSSLRGFEGIHSNLSFTPKRVNGVLSILQYRRRMITRLGQFDLAAGEFFPSKE
jgi:ABC-type branched-subunit amino acid transport system substrate-binding protein